MLAALIVSLLRVLAQVSITVSAPLEIAERDPVLVQVEVTAPAGRDVQIVAPSFAPFRVVTTSVVTGVDSAALRRGALRAAWQTVEYRYVLAAPAGATGRYAFEPFEARVRAPGLREAVSRSAAWSLAVRRPAQAPTVATGSGVPAIVERAQVDPRTGINFHALATPDTVFVGQQATYQVGVFLDETVRSRLRRNPEFLPPELRAMLAYELPAGRASVRDRVIAGKRWDVHVFQRAVFPLAPGRTDVPPAQLSYSLPLSLGFFSREESYTARSEPATVIAIAPPAAGRPADWVGAVGVLRAASRIDTSRARVGDPLVVTLRVEGTGNVKLLPRPRLDLDWATAVAGEERVQIDSGAMLVRGAKEFDWIVTPRSQGDHTVPAIRYPYFDPYARRYDVADGTPLPVTVAPGTLATNESDSARSARALDIRLTDSGPLPAPLPSRAGFWLVVLLAPLPAAALLVARRPRAPRRATPSARVLHDLTKGARPADVRAVRRTFAAALSDRLALRHADTPIVSARAGTLARRLCRCGVTRETAGEVEALVHTLDAASYAAALPTSVVSTHGAPSLAGAAEALYARVDREARSRVALVADVAARRRPTVGRLGALALVIGTAGVVARAYALASPADDFTAGVAAYRAARYPDAARHFSAAADVEQRSPDAWANAGTAAWSAGDTVSAAVGWQRAIRLDPRADDVRRRLELLPSTPNAWYAVVPALPLDWVAGTALGLWIAACLAGALPLANKGPSWPLLPFGVAALMGASASAVVAAQIARVADGRQLAIVRTHGPLRAEPTLGGEPNAAVEPTEMARVLARRSVWARVAMDDGRTGWIEMDRLAPVGTLR